MKKRGEPVRANDVIAYVITGDGQDYNKNVAERAYSPQDVIKSGSDLKVGIIRSLYMLIKTMYITWPSRYFRLSNVYVRRWIVQIQQG